MGKGVELTGKNKEKIYPVTASDLVYDKDTKKSIKTSLNEKVEEAPMDGKQYARLNGAWAEVEAGAVSENALITLTPAVDELKGVSVTVTTSEGETVLNTTWQGATLTAQIRAGLQYTVAVGNKDGFIAPSSVTYTAEKGVSRSINMNYTESRLKVSILSNQSNDATIAAVEATVKYGSTSIQVTNGGYVNLPLNTSVTITFPAVEGYKTPDSITYIHTGGSYEKTGIYQTEVVRVTLSADNGADLIGQVITINGVQHTWGGTVVEQKVAFGTEYTVSVSDKDGYTTPASQSYVAAESSKDLAFVYEEIPLGVFIQGVSGKLYTEDEWNNQETVNGIAVSTEECRFVMALTNTGSSCRWAESAITIEGIPMYSSIEDAIVDYDGETNTTIIIDELANNSINSGTAAHLCRSYMFPNGQNGYLGSVGEWQAAFDNKEIINSAITKCLGYELTLYYWTSTQMSWNHSYMIYWNETGFGNDYKTGIHYALPFCSFKK